MLTIYGVHRSRALRNIWLAEELGLTYKLIPVIQAYRLEEPDAEDAPFNTNSPDFLEINPAGQIPVIDDDGLILRESLAINLYLARKHGGPLAAASLAEEGAMMQWSFWGATEIESNALKIQQTYGDNLEGTLGGREVLAVSLRQLRRPFALLDSHLAEHGFLLGNRFTVADLNVVELVRYATSEAGLFEANPNVAVWLKTCHARPCFQKVWQIRQDEPA